MCNSQGVEKPEVEHAPLPEIVETREPLNKALMARLIVAVLIVTAFVVFAVQNTAKVEISFLSWSFQLSQFLMMLLSAIAGVVIWEFAGFYSRRAKKKAAK